ncbi:hypothetical protein [Psychroflexus planctonicus]|uniref:hypothetical protein n=1 Tax=Psychroflexus planctonicus TaxID=1526575 RepID=UPI001663A55C|nr:hypothetical protein [Psychroflexus planctonicus]
MYNEKKYSLDNKGKKKETITQFRFEYKPFSFSELNVYKWGFLTAIENNLFDFASEKPYLIDLTKRTQSVRPKNIAEKINAIWIKIRYTKKLKGNLNFDDVKSNFIDSLELFKTLEKHHLNKLETKELRGEIIEALEKIEFELETIDQRRFISKLIAEFEDTKKINPFTITISLTSIFYKLKNDIKNNKKIDLIDLKNRINRAKEFYRIVQNNDFDKTEIENLKDDINDLLTKIENEFAEAKDKDKRFIAELIEDFKSIDLDLKMFENKHFTTMATTKERVHKRIAIEAFFKVLKEVSDPKTTYKGVIINTANWNELKDLFFEQRMKAYESSLNSSEKIKLENELLDQLKNESESILKGIKKQQFNTLVDRYKSLLNTPQKKTKNKPTFEDFFTGIEKQQIEQLKDFSNGFNSKKSAIFIDLLYNEFRVLDVIPGNKKGKSPKDFAKLFNTETYSGLNDFFDKSKTFNGIKLTYKDQEQSEYLQMKTRLETILK